MQNECKADNDVYVSFMRSKEDQYWMISYANIVYKYMIANSFPVLCK